ncbi:MAG: hypothetical protein ACO262_06225 [Vulcanococcus sp.]
MSKFIVVDLSGASVPAELQSILSQIKKPILAFGNAYAMFPDVADQVDVLTIEGRDSELLNGLEERLPDLESLHAKRIVELARRYEKAEKERLRKG